MSDTENTDNITGIISDLSHKRDAAMARVEEIARERKALAFAAHAEGDAKARKRLHELNLESVTIIGEIETIDAALAEAKSRFDTINQAEALEIARGRALELRERTGELVDLAKRVDDALAIVSSDLSRFHDLINEILYQHGGNEIFGGNAAITATLFAVRALCTAIGKTPYARDFPLVPPLERRKLSDLVVGRTDEKGRRTPGWVDRIEARINELLGETAEKAA